MLSRMAVPNVWAVANSGNLRKWIQPLRGLGPAGIPVAAPMVDPLYNKANGYPYDAHFYQIGVGEYTDQLHPDLGPTRLWGYYDKTAPLQRHLGGLIVAQRGTPVRIRFTNELPDRHIIPVDTTLPGANQAQNRIATHIHGGLIPWISDGGPFDWWTPSGASGLSFLNGPGGVLDNIPTLPMLPGQADYWYPNDQSFRLAWYHDHAHGITRINAYAGIASGYLMLDAINDAYVAAGKIPGLASTIPLVFQDKVFVHPGTYLTDPTWATVARADCQSTGSLWYEHVYDPNVFMHQPPPGAPPLPDPSCVPEFFGDTMLCNGTVYPLLTVEAKRYRFLVLNACNARFLNINLFRAKPKAVEGIVLDPVTLFPLNPPGPKMYQIGTEGGFLAGVVKLNSPVPFNPLTLTGNLILAPAERADLIIDFSKFAGEEIIMYNDAPGPFPGGAPDTDYFLGNPLNPVQPKPGTGPDTRQILRIKVIPATAPDPQLDTKFLQPAMVDPPLLVPPVMGMLPVPPLPIPAGVPVRDISLNEEFDAYGRLTQTLGTLTPGPRGGLGREYLEPPTEVPKAGTVEVWRLWNLSADTHPIHIHLVNFQILQRQAFAVDAAGAPILDANGVPLLTGAPRGPELNELGWKETAQMHPGEVITIIMKFDLPNPALVPFNVPSSPRATLSLPQDPAADPPGMGLPAGKKYHEFVYHCHILEHEEHDMMRPLIIEE